MNPPIQLIAVLFRQLAQRQGQLALAQQLCDERVRVADPKIRGRKIIAVNDSQEE